MVASLKNSNHKAHEWKKWLNFRKHTIQQEMSAAVVLYAQNEGQPDGVLRQRARLAGMKQWEEPFSSLFLSLKQDTKQLFLQSPPRSWVLSHHHWRRILAPLSAIYIQFSKLGNQQMQKETDYCWLIRLCLVSTLTVGPSSHNNRYNWHSE